MGFTKLKTKKTKITKITISLDHHDINKKKSLDSYGVSWKQVLKLGLDRAEEIFYNNGESIW